MTIQDIFNMATEKTWVDGVPFTVVTVGQASRGKYGLEQNIGIKDNAGQMGSIKIQTELEVGLLDMSAQGQTLLFRVKWFNSRAGKALAGYTTQPLQMGGTAPQAPVQQATQPQTTNYIPQTSQAPVQQPIRDVQDEIRFAQALNRACDDHVHDKIAEPSIQARTEIYYKILCTRQFPAEMSHDSDILGEPAPF